MRNKRVSMRNGNGYETIEKKRKKSPVGDHPVLCVFPFFSKKNLFQKILSISAIEYDVTSHAANYFFKKKFS